MKTYLLDFPHFIIFIFQKKFTTIISYFLPNIRAYKILLGDSLSKLFNVEVLAYKFLINPEHIRLCSLQYLLSYKY